MNPCFSLQATSIRNSISRALRDSKKDTAGLSQNSVYAYPTIASLAQYVSQLALGAMENGASDVTARLAAMEFMVKEFTQDFPNHTTSKLAPKDEVVLATGTTGALGSHILHKLIATPYISRVYALNRPDKLGKSTLHERQKKALEEHGVSLSVLNSPKLILLEGDTSSSDLGLPKETVDEIVQSVTSIIHNGMFHVIAFLSGRSWDSAWRVDFNLSLPSFKPLVRGVRNLINLSLASPFPKPPPVVFVSSVGALAGALS